MIGAAVGVAAGLLTAPKSGKETREDIKTRLVTLKAKLLKNVTNYYLKAEEIGDDVRTKVIEAVESVKVLRIISNTSW